MSSKEVMRGMRDAEVVSPHVIRSKRQVLRLTQKEVSEASGFSRSMISAFETGARTLFRYEADRIVRAMEYIVSGRSED